MIDHVSIPVSNLSKSSEFYESLLAELEYKKLVSKSGTVGFGKKYPDFWLNERPALSVEGISDGFHVCIRASSVEQVNAFHRKGIALGGKSDGVPGFREQYSKSYYAAFIQDVDGNRLEAVTFVS